MIRDLILAVLISLPVVLRGEVVVDENGVLDDSDVNDAPDVYVKIEAVPSAALKKLRADAAGVDFDEVEIEIINGVTVYALEWESASGQIYDTAVGVDGDLIKRDQKITADAVPGSVQRTIKAYFPPAAKLEVEYTAFVTYEVQDVFDGEVRKMEIDPTGALLDAEGVDIPQSLDDGNAVRDQGYNPGYVIVRPIEMEELPAAVHQTLLSEADGVLEFDAIAREAFIGSDRFEAVWVSDGRTFEAHLSEDGQLLEKSHTLDKDEMPSSVRDVVDRYLPDGTEPIYRSKLTLFYDVDAAFILQDYRLLVDPEGRILEADGSPDRTMSAPTIQLVGNEVVVHHQTLLGMPSPRLEVAADLNGTAWTEIPMAPTGGFVLEARLPRSQTAFFRIRFGGE